MQRLSAASTVFLACFASSAAMAAPLELYGRSVVVNWTETRSVTYPEQPFAPNATVPLTYVLHVTGDGRTVRTLSSAAFVVPTRRAARHAKPVVDSVRFEGNTIVASSPADGVSHRIEIALDNNFDHCLARVYAKAPAVQTVLIKAGATPAVAVKAAPGPAVVPFDVVFSGIASCSVEPGAVLAY